MTATIYSSGGRIGMARQPEITQGAITPGAKRHTDPPQAKLARCAGLPFHNAKWAALRGSLVLALVSASLVVSAQQPPAAQEKAVTWNADDSQLKWGPCPPFLPKGCGIAVLHGDPAKDNVDVFLKVPGKSVLPLHFHTSAERMVLVAGKLEATYDGQKTVVLKPGTYAYGPAKLPHKAVCASTTGCVLFIAFESPLDAVPVDIKAK